MTAARSTSTGSDTVAAKHARRAVIAATIGTTIEFYDFYLYGFAAALVFGKLFFPSQDPYSATLLSFSTFFIGFVARPIGAVIFGHLGDRLGRKTTLIATLMLMGVGTAVIGIIPTYESIGIWGAVLLTLMRIVQGIGIGGEWGGAVAVATEWKQFNKRRGLAGSWPQFGSPLGLLTSMGVLAIVSNMGSKEWFESVGWRIPFLLSIVLIFVGLYVRIGILETTAFQKIKEQGQVVKAPVIDAIRYYWREILLTSLIRTGQTGPFFLFTTYLLAYGTSVLKLDQNFLFNCVIVAAVVSLFTTPLWGYVSDLIGRKRMYMIGAFTMLLFAFPYFWLLNSLVPALIVSAVVLSFVIHDMQYGPLAAFASESFPPSVRYSGSSLGYQFACMTTSGPTPIIAAWLLHDFGTSAAISWFIVIGAAISFVSAALLKDRSHEDYISDTSGIAEQARRDRAGSKVSVLTASS
jgi:MFS family permease